MPYLIALAGVIAAVYFFVIRARNAADMASELVDVAADVRSAARRFGFKRRANVHPMETVEEPSVIAATIGISYLELDGLPSEAAQSRLRVALAQEFQTGVKDAEEMMVFGRWLMGECQGPQPAIDRAARRMFKLGQGKDLAALMAVIQAVSPEEGLTDRQRDALEDIKRAFRIK